MGFCMDIQKIPINGVSSCSLRSINIHFQYEAQQTPAEPELSCGGEGSGIRNNGGNQETAFGSERGRGGHSVEGCTESA
jgi:hypothetical protein